MLRYIALAFFLTGTSAFAMDEAQLDAIISSCQAGQVCSCPRAKLSKIPASVCHEPPADYDAFDDGSVKAYAQRVDVYSRCMDKRFYANLKIDRYNEIFDSCQRRDNSLRPSVVPSRAALNQQLQDVKPLRDEINRENAAAVARERARIAAMPREKPSTESAVEPDVLAKIAAAQQSRPTEQMPRPSLQQPQAGLISMNGKHIIECKPFHQHIICLSEEPSKGIYSGLNDRDDNMGDRVNGQIADITGSRALYERMQ